MVRKRASSGKSGSGPRGQKRSHKGAIISMEEEQWLQPDPDTPREALKTVIEAPNWPAGPVVVTAVQQAAQEVAAKRHKQVGTLLLAVLLTVSDIMLMLAADLKLERQV